MLTNYLREFSNIVSLHKILKILHFSFSLNKNFVFFFSEFTSLHKYQFFFEFTLVNELS